MANLTIQVVDQQGNILEHSQSGRMVDLAYHAAYQPGDQIQLLTDTPGTFCNIRLEDSIMPSIVYIPGDKAVFQIPFEEKRACYSPKSFVGDCHLITAAVAEDAQVYSRRNLALNTFDQHGETGMFPHASANIETRGESVFAAHNTIDGVYANAGHGPYPYQSWGINRRSDAELRIDFGLPVTVDEVRLTLRADFPHDSYWTQATLEFSDGSQVVVSLVKTHLPQAFKIEQRTITSLNQVF